MPHGISREELHYFTVRFFRDGFEEEIKIMSIKIVRRTQVCCRVFTRVCFLRVK